jgi:diaminopimelate epimerase
LDERRFKAIAVDAGNPHAVVILKTTDSLAALNLSEEPDFDHGCFPRGVNCGFARAQRPGLIELRVYERGVGETMACGSGTVAAVTAYAYAAGVTGQPLNCSVVVPGGRLEVELDATGEAFLIGSAVITAHGIFDAVAPVCDVTDDALPRAGLRRTGTAVTDDALVSTAQVRP